MLKKKKKQSNIIARMNLKYNVWSVFITHFLMHIPLHTCKKVTEVKVYPKLAYSTLVVATFFVFCFLSALTVAPWISIEVLLTLEHIVIIKFHCQWTHIEFEYWPGGYNMYVMVLTELILSFLSNLDLLIDGILLFFLDIKVTSFFCKGKLTIPLFNFKAILSVQIAFHCTYR